MAKEKKVEYERVDEEGDVYKRILVKFNPRFLRGSEFEIEFIPLENSVEIGKVFVTDIDSMSTIDLYRWACRDECLMRGLGDYERGTIIPRERNNLLAEAMKAGFRRGTVELEPRQIISRVKRTYELVANEFCKATAFALNHFFWSGELGSMPCSSKYFTIDRLKLVIEEGPYYCKNADGEVVKRPLVDNLFDTHQTEYICGAINNFLEALMSELREGK